MRMSSRATAAEALFGNALNASVLAQISPTARLVAADRPSPVSALALDIALHTACVIPRDAARNASAKHVPNLFISNTAAHSRVNAT
jgi:hypothetical protein